MRLLLHQKKTVPTGKHEGARTEWGVCGEAVRSFQSKQALSPDPLKRPLLKHFNKVTGFIQ